MYIIGEGGMSNPAKILGKLRYFMSMFLSMKYEPGVKYTECAMITSNPYGAGEETEVSFGFHSYKRQSDAEEVAIRTGCWKVVVKCEIPAGARYWIGNRNLKNDSGYAEYCSDAIVTVAYKLPGEDNEWIDVSGERQ
jgi:hypothetical protein